MSSDILSVTFGTGILAMTTVEFWLSVLGSTLATVFCAAVTWTYRSRIKHAFEATVTASHLYRDLAAIRMTRFTRTRDDYNRHRHTHCVACYIKQAKRTLTIISVNLVTGVHGCPVMSN